MRTVTDRVLDDARSSRTSSTSSHDDRVRDPDAGVRRDPRRAAGRAALHHRARRPPARQPGPGVRAADRRRAPPACRSRARPRWRCSSSAASWPPRGARRPATTSSPSSAFEPLTQREFDVYFVLLATAGNETTRHTITHGLLALLEHPDQLAARCATTRRCYKPAAEEMLRWATPVHHFRRTDDAATPSWRAARSRAGDKVTTWFVSGNRDEDGLRGPRHASTSAARRTSTWRSARAASTTAWARTSPGWRSRSRSRSCSSACRTIELAGEPGAPALELLQRHQAAAGAGDAVIALRRLDHVRAARRRPRRGGARAGRCSSAWSSASARTRRLACDDEPFCARAGGRASRASSTSPTSCAARCSLDDAARAPRPRYGVAAGGGRRGRPTPRATRVLILPYRGDGTRLTAHARPAGDRVLGAPAQARPRQLPHRRDRRAGRRSTRACSAWRLTDWLGDGGVWLHINGDHHVMALVDKGVQPLPPPRLRRRRHRPDARRRSTTSAATGAGSAGARRAMASAATSPPTCGSSRRSASSSSTATWSSSRPSTSRASGPTTATRPTPGGRCRRARTSASTPTPSPSERESLEMLGRRCPTVRRLPASIPRTDDGAVEPRPVAAVALRRRLPRRRLLGRPGRGASRCCRRAWSRTRRRPLRRRVRRLAVVQRGRRRAARPGRARTTRSSSSSSTRCSTARRSRPARSSGSTRTSRSRAGGSRASRRSSARSG